MRSNKIIYLVAAIALLLLPTFVFAATPGGADEKSGNYNMVLISLMSLVLILLLVIGVLAMTLRQLSFVVRDKMRKDRQPSSNAVKALLLLISLSIPAFHAFAADAVKTAAPVSHSFNGIPENDYYTILTVLAIELIVIFALVINIRMLLRVISSKPELAAAAAKAMPQHNWFWDKFNAAASLEHEKDILLDHNYDGIQELDNSLPPWWKYGFYLTIIVAVIYFYRFHVSHDGPSSHDEFVAEMQKGDEDKAAYLTMAGNNVDENTVTLLKDPADIAAGREIFVKTCAQCHRADGGGVVGPNLTDDYWLHGGSIKDIFKTIKYGWQDKGMKSWKNDFSPKQIQQLASFVKSIRGTKPPMPKLEQGELYIEASNSSDSSSKINDSTKAVKNKAG